MPEKGEILAHSAESVAKNEGFEGGEKRNDSEPISLQWEETS